MKTDRIEWWQIGHNASTVKPHRYPTQEAAERAAKRDGANVYRVDYHGIVGEEPSKENAGRKLE